MPPRTIFPRSADAPIRFRLAIGWGAFFLFVLAGLWFYARLGGTVPALLEVVPR
jgi:hypothetical protein